MLRPASRAFVPAPDKALDSRAFARSLRSLDSDIGCGRRAMTSRDGQGAVGPVPADQPSAQNPVRIRPYLTGPHPGSKPTGAKPADDDPGSSGGSERPRPFVLTSGRVDGVDPDINLEAQVTASPVPPRPAATLPPELQAIVEICAEPVSVAEISARVPLHLGVTKILVGDLRANGYVNVHNTDVVDPHDPETILRVIRGLREIA